MLRPGRQTADWGKVYYGVAGQSQSLFRLQSIGILLARSQLRQPILTLNGYLVRSHPCARVCKLGVLNARRERPGQQVFYLADSSSLPSNFAVQLASSGGASVGAGLVGYSYLNSYQSGTAGQKLKTVLAWAVADLGWIRPVQSTALPNFKPH